jgi:hypothetical protein
VDAADPCKAEKTNLSYFKISEDIKLPDICKWWWFGRFRKDADVEHLAGEARAPQILRPVELTLVPDRISDFMDLTAALRHAVHLCVLLSNQQKLIRNSYTLRICLIQHLFTRVIPLPLAFNNPNR